MRTGRSGHGSGTAAILVSHVVFVLYKMRVMPNFYHYYMGEGSVNITYLLYFTFMIRVQPVGADPNLSHLSRSLATG